MYCIASKERRKNKKFLSGKGTTNDGVALLIKGIDPRVVFTCHRHSSAKACRAHYLSRSRAV